MVPIIESNRPKGFLERASLGFQNAAQTIPDLLAKHERAKQAQSLETNLGLPGLSSFLLMSEDPAKGMKSYLDAVRAQAAYQDYRALNSGSDISPQGNAMSESENQNGGDLYDQVSLESQEPFRQQPSMQQAQRNPSELTSEGIRRKAIYNPQAANIDARLYQAQQQKTSGYEQQNFKSLEGMSKAAEEARLRVASLDRAKALLKTKKIGPSFKNVVVAQLIEKGSPLANVLQDPEVAQFNATIKDMLSGVKKFAGSRPTEKEVFFYNTILPNLLKTVPANEAVIDFLKKQDDYILQREKVANTLLRNNPGMNPFELQDKVSGYMDKYLERMEKEAKELERKYAIKGKKAQSQRTLVVEPGTGKKFYATSPEDVEEARSAGWEVLDEQ